MAAIIGVLLLTGCAISSPPEKDTSPPKEVTIPPEEDRPSPEEVTIPPEEGILPPKEVPSFVFYPSLPDPPRIQYLTTFSSAKDVVEFPSDFADLIADNVSEEETVVGKPYGAAFFEGKLFVVDTRALGYAVFDLEKQQFKFIPGSGDGKMKKPINITIDRNGTRYITDTERSQVLAFDREDRFLRAYGGVEQFRPGDVVIVEGQIYVSDLEHHNIQILDKQSGQLLFKFGKAGAEEGELFWPTNMTLGPDNQLYVTDTGNARLQVFTLDGKFVRSYGSLGVGFGQFVRPKGIAVDRKGRIYVADAAFDNIQILNPDGKILLFFGEPGDKPENISLPAKVIVDYESVPLFRKYTDPKFKLEYVIAVVSQFGGSKVSVFGFGKMKGVDYSATGQAVTK